MATNPPSPKSGEGRGLLSCWGRLKLKFPWARIRPIRSSRRSASTSSSSSSSSTRNLHRPILCGNDSSLDCKSMSPLAVVQPKAVGGFKYDPMSYSQNFDEGCWNDDIEAFQHGFSSRYAAPQSYRSVMASKSATVKSSG